MNFNEIYFLLERKNGMMRKNVKVYENIYRWIIFSNFELLECWRSFLKKI
jgi:hypothetical protein